MENYEQLQQIYRDYRNNTHITGPEIIARVSLKISMTALFVYVIRWMTGMNLDVDMSYCGIYEMDYE
ncbi:hypothetical protein [Companilactobacillus sp. HBUAS56257]|uniref:hypothetical protein n=1 Tax=Companilactobacillus sp. HBUAS56257 TaxID=3109360 RepID=UPI002FF39A00